MADTCGDQFIQMMFLDPTHNGIRTLYQFPPFQHIFQSHHTGGNVFRLRGIDRTDIQISAAVFLCLQDLIRIVRGGSDEQSRRDFFCDPYRQITLPEMHAVSSRCKGNIHPVINDEQSSRGQFPALFRQFIQFLIRQMFCAQLQDHCSARHDRRHHIGDGASVAEFRADHRIDAAFLKHLYAFRQCYFFNAHFFNFPMIRSAAFFPDMSIPPKIGPIRYPPITLFALIPEAKRPG